MQLLEALKLLHRNWNAMLPSPNVIRGLLGHFTCGAAQPALSLPVQSYTALRPLFITVECKPRPRWPEILHSPQHLQAAQLVKTIRGINKFCPACLGYLGQDFCSFQCHHIPSTSSSPSSELPSSSISSTSTNFASASGYVPSTSTVRFLVPPPLPCLIRPLLCLSPEGMAYHLADCAAKRCQQKFQTDSPRTPLSRCNRCCDGGSHRRLPSTTGAPCRG